MSVHLPTASALPLAEHCVYAWTSGIPWPDEPPSDDTEVGSAVSMAAECLAVWGDAPAIVGPSPSKTETIRQMASHVRELLAEEAKTDRWRVAEQGLAINLRWGTARELKQDGDRDYSDRDEGEITGTPDLVRCTGDGRLVVRDYKTGRYARHKDARTHMQLRALALGAARCYGFDEVTVELVQVDADRLYVRKWVLDAFELDVVADQLRTIYDRIAGPEPDMVPRVGRWCVASYCHLRGGACPASTKALAEADQATEPRFPLAEAIESKDHAAEMYGRLKLAEARIEVLRQAIRDYVREHGPIDVGDGMRFGAMQKEGRPRIDMDVLGVEDAIERHLGPFARVVAVTRRTSKSALEAAARDQQTKRGEGVAKARELFDELRAMGALKRGPPYEQYDEYKARD